MKESKLIFWCDVINFIIGFLIIGMVIALFLEIEARIMMIPAILCLGGMMNLLTAAKYDVKMQRLFTALFLVIGCVLQGVAVISIIQIWRG